MGSAALSVTLSRSVLTSSACILNSPNCLRQYAACISIASTGFLALARRVARSKPVLRNVHDLSVERHGPLSSRVKAIFPALEHGLESVRGTLIERARQ